MPQKELRASKLNKLRTIVKEHQAEEIEGVLVDATTASLLVKVHDALSDRNRERFLEFPLVKMTEIAWRLTEKEK